MDIFIFSFYLLIPKLYFKNYPPGGNNIQTQTIQKIVINFLYLIFSINIKIYKDKINRFISTYKRLYKLLI